jgi:hypothetical protein
MTQVRMLQTVTGAFHGNPLGARRGEIVDVTPDSEAQRYIATKLAEPLGEERAVPDTADEIETAVPAKRGPGRPKKVPNGTI